MSALSTAVNIVAHTPLWVWPLYALLLALGLQRTRDSITPLWRMLILPLVVFVLTGLTFIGAGPALPFMLLGLAAGGIAGWHLEGNNMVRRLPGGAVWLRGEWWTLIQIAVVLVVRYSANVIPVLDPLLASSPLWRAGTLLITTALSALFLGRTVRRIGIYFGWRDGPVVRNAEQ